MKLKNILQKRCSQIFLLVAVMLLFAGCSTVPYTDRSQLMFYSESDDISLGNQAWQEIAAQSTQETQGAQIAQLKRVGKQIAAIADKKQYDWEFYVLNSDQVNAFALPGGKIAFYKPIFTYFANDSEVAVVMGHEIAHVIARHSMERQSQVNVQSLGWSAISALTDDESQRNVLRAVYGVTSNLGAILPYSPKHEYEADYIGMILMAKAGYDPGAAVTFWKKFGALESSSGGFLNTFLSTHPMSEDRLAEMQKNLPEIRAKYFRQK